MVMKTYELNVFQKAKKQRRGDAYFPQELVGERIAYWIEEDFNAGKKVPYGFLNIQARYTYGGTVYLSVKLIGKKIVVMKMEDYHEYRQAETDIIKRQLQ